MKTTLIILLSIFVGFTAFSQNKTDVKPKLDIYYFHSSHRCATCISIEENTKKVLDSFFKKEVEAGTIKLTIMDCEDSKYKDLVDKYGAYGSTLILQSNTGKNVKEDMTNFAFSYSKNEPAKFNEGLKEKITNFLK